MEKLEESRAKIRVTVKTVIMAISLLVYVLTIFHIKKIIYENKVLNYFSLLSTFFGMNAGSIFLV